MTASTRFSARIAARLERAFHPPRRAIPTRAGLFALMAPIVLGVAAVNASNNLLFMLLGGVLGAIVLSGILSERNLRGVEVDVHPVSAAYVDEPARLQVAFLRRGAPAGAPNAYALHFVERRARSLRAYFRPKTDPGLLEVRLPVLEGTSGARLGTRTFRQRGRARLGYSELMTRYPFGLLTKARDADVAVDVLVRPRQVPAPAELLEPRGLASEGDDSLRRGLGLELYGLREREDRDAVHRVHALRSLSLGREVVIETAGIERPIAWLGLASTAGAHAEAFERALELAQAILVAWDERGYAVGLATATGLHDPGSTSLSAMLDALALLEPAPALAITPPSGAVLWLVPEGASAPAGADAVAHVSVSGALALGRSAGARGEAA